MPVSTTILLPWAPSDRRCRRPHITPTQTTTLLRQRRQPLRWARLTLRSSNRTPLQPTVSRYVPWPQDTDDHLEKSNVSQLMHHLYFPAGPHKEDLLPYQRAPHDFFISEKLRQDLQKKSEAALQIISEYASPIMLKPPADLARHRSPAA